MLTGKIENSDFEAFYNSLIDGIDFPSFIVIYLFTIKHAILIVDTQKAILKRIKEDKREFEADYFDRVNALCWDVATISKVLKEQAIPFADDVNELNRQIMKANVSQLP